MRFVSQLNNLANQAKNFLRRPKVGPKAPRKRPPPPKRHVRSSPGGGAPRNQAQSNAARVREGHRRAASIINQRNIKGLASATEVARGKASQAKLDAYYRPNIDRFAADMARYDDLLQQRRVTEYQATRDLTKIADRLNLGAVMPKELELLYRDRDRFEHGGPRAPKNLPPKAPAWRRAGGAALRGLGWLGDAAYGNAAGSRDRWEDTRGRELQRAIEKQREKERREGQASGSRRFGLGESDEVNRLRGAYENERGWAFFGAYGLNRFAPEPVQKVLTETRGSENRARLQLQGETETSGQRLVRNLDQAAAYYVPGERGGRLRARAREGQGRYNRTGDFRQLGVPGTDYSRSKRAMVFDVVEDLALDPLNLVPFGKLGKLSEIRSASQGARLLRSPIGETILEQVARAGERAATAGGGATAFDARMLARLVPSLRRDGALSPLTAALASRTGDEALRFLSTIDAPAGRVTPGQLRRAGATADEFAAAAGSRATQATALREMIEAQGMTVEARKGLARLALGVEWQPKLGLPAKVLSSLPAGSDALGVLARGLLRAPGVRQAKPFSLVGAVGKTLRGRKGTSLLPAVALPKTLEEAQELVLDAGQKSDAADLASDFMDDLGGQVADGAIPDGAVDVLGYQMARLDNLNQIVGTVADPELKRVLELRVKRLKNQLRLQGLAQERTALAAGLDAGLELTDELVDQLDMVETDVFRSAQLTQRQAGKAERVLVEAMAKEQWASSLRPAPRWNPITRAWSKLPFHTTAPRAIQIERPFERAKGMRDWAIAMGATGFQADELFSVLVAELDPATAENIITSARDRMYLEHMRKLGVDAASQDKVIEVIGRVTEDAVAEQSSWQIISPQSWRELIGKAGKPSSKKIFDITGETTPQTVAQRSQLAFVMAPTDFSRAVREVRAEQGEIASKIAAGLDRVTHPIGVRYLAVHHKWKLYALVSAPVRYMLRIGFDERGRLFDEYGVQSFTMFGGRRQRKLLRRWTDETDGALFAEGLAEIGWQNTPLHLIDKGAGGIKHLGYGVLKEGDHGFVENAWSVYVKSVNPDTDPLHMMLLPELHKGGDAGMAEAMEWLGGSQAGHEYMEMARRVMGTDSPGDVVMRTRDWLKRHVPNQKAADLRMKGRLSLDEFRKRPELWPEETYGDKYTSLLLPDAGSKSIKDINPIKALQRFTLETGTIENARQPMYMREIDSEYRSLVQSGVHPLRAGQLADQYAVRRVNRILFDSSQSSQLAKNLDVVFPFAAANEEFFLYTVRALKNNPGRVAQRLNFYATAVNGGIQNGIIGEDKYGQLTMRVPGSALLSRALGRYTPDWVPGSKALKTLASDFDYTMRLKDLLFFQDAYGLVPRPGGPLWSAFTNVWFSQAPETVFKNELFREWALGFGAAGNLLPRHELTVIAQGLFGIERPWWEPFAGAGIASDDRKAYYADRYNKLMLETARMEDARWRAGGMKGPPPSAEDIERSARTAMAIGGVLGLINPANPQIVTTMRQDFDEATAAYAERNGGVFSVEGFLDERPEMAAYFVGGYRDSIREGNLTPSGLGNSARVRQRNPEYYAQWLNDKNDYKGDENFERNLFSAKQSFSLDEFMKRLEENRDVARSFEDLDDIWSNIQDFGIGYTPERQAALSDWEEKYQGKAGPGLLRKNYIRDRELDSIVARADWSERQRNDAIDAWQYKYDVSGGVRKQLLLKSMTMLKAAPSPTLGGQYQPGRTGRGGTYNPWKETRNTLDLIDHFRNNNELQTEEYFERMLSPAERVQVATVMQAQAKGIDEYDGLKELKDLAWAEMNNTKWGVKPSTILEDIEERSTREWQEKKDFYFTEQLGPTFTQLNAQIEARDQALALAKAGDKSQWAVWKEAKAAVNRSYAVINGAKNAMHQRHPKIVTWLDEVKYFFLTRDPEKEAAIKRGEGGKYGVEYWASPEEQQYLNMPDRIQQSYVEDLVDRLTVPAGQYTSKGDLFRSPKAALRWSYLSDWQKDLLTVNSDDETIDTMKRLDGYERDEIGKRARKAWKKRQWASKTGGSGGLWEIDGYGFGEGFGELAYALENLQTYNKRGTVFQDEPLWDQSPYGKQVSHTHTFKGKQYTSIIDYSQQKVFDKKTGTWQAAWFFATSAIEKFDTGEFIMRDKRTGWVKHRLTGVWAPNTGWFKKQEYWSWLGKTANGKKAAPWKLLEQFYKYADNQDLRAGFLRRHPELQEWMRLGPMQQMPEVVSMITRNIMVKYGKWEDPAGPKTWDEITNLSWARHQMEKYNKRRGASPQAFEKWVNMTNSAERVKYFKENPSIQKWIQSGPMANMPLTMREAVREIMLSYGEWEKKTDPMSQLMAKYYAVPSYAKQGFLDKHPELLQYWRALRTGEELVQYDKAQRYFAIRDPKAKREYLKAHPEVQDYFVKERELKYEQFLNRAARYLGNTPGGLESYVKNQTATIERMLKSMTTRPLVVKTAVVTSSRATTGRMPYYSPNRREAQAQGTQANPYDQLA